MESCYLKKPGMAETANQGKRDVRRIRAGIGYASED